MSIRPVSKVGSDCILLSHTSSQKIEDKVEGAVKRKFYQEEKNELNKSQKIFNNTSYSADSYQIDFSTEESFPSVKKRRDEAKQQPPLEFPQESSSNKAMPLTPMKKRNQQVSTPLVNTCKQIASGKLERGGHLYELVPDFDARGDYKQLYVISDKGPQLVNGYANCEVRIKALHEYCLNRSNPDAIQDFWNKSCKSQIELKNLGFPVAQTLNSPIEDGYEVVVYIRNAIDPKKWAGIMPIVALDTDLVFLLRQARDILTRATKENLLLDLSPNNMRFNDCNELNVIDSLVEEDPLDSFLNDRNTTKLCWLKSALTSWANGNPYVYALLTEDIAKMGTPASQALATFG